MSLLQCLPLARPAADDLLDAGGQPRFEWLGLIAFYGRPAIDLANARRWGVLGLIKAFTAGSRHSRPCPPDECAELLQRPMSALVGRFGFPPTRAAANVLSKLTIDASDDCTLRGLRILMTRLPDEARPLAHLPRVNRIVMEVLDDAGGIGRHVAPSLLSELALLDDRADAADPFRQPAGPWHRLLAERQRVGPAERIGRLRSMADVEACAARLAAIPDEPIVARDEMLTAELEFLPMPRPKTPPPASEPGRIEALADADACAAEGDAMRHCAAERWPMVANGVAALYRVCADPAANVERATLELAALSDGRGWGVLMLRGVKNRRVSLATWRRVHAWLAASEALHL